jgi:CRP-like cAMP-binding protein
MSVLPESITEKFIFKSNTVFSNLPNNIKEAFLGQMVLRQYKKGQNLFTEGTYPAGIYFIKEGKVKKYKSLNGGKEQIIYVYCEGELLGYAALLSEETYPDSAASLTDAVIGFLSKEKMMRLLDRHAEISKMLMKNLSHEFGVLVNFIASFTQKTVRERVALTLLILWVKFSDRLNADNEVQIVLTREELANMVGTAVETLVRVLHEFKKEGIISTSGRAIRILKPMELTGISKYF